MACKINWTTKASQTFEANLEYLRKEWTAKEINKFVSSVEKKISILSDQPEIGKSGSEKHPHIRCTIIHKRIALIYKYKPQKKEIDILVFWNTYQNPGKLKLSSKD